MTVDLTLLLLFACFSLPGGIFHSNRNDVVYLNTLYAVYKFTTVCIHYTVCITGCRNSSILGKFKVPLDGVIAKSNKEQTKVMKNEQEYIILKGFSKNCVRN